MDFPHFRYHPDPLKTGSIEPSDEVCAICGQARGYDYTASFYWHGAGNHIVICPWCIADGSAAKKLNGSFNDGDFFGDPEDDFWSRVPKEVLEELTYRTPSFATWQSENWFYHCDDAGAFLGSAGYPELLAYGEEAIASLKAYGEWDDTEETEWQAFLKALNKHGSSVAYVFQCLHCGKYGVYQDCD